MRLEEALRLSSLRDAQVVAGLAGLSKEIRWAHVVDLPEPAPWVSGGQLLLTTGIAWPREAQADRTLVEVLAGRELAGIGLAVPGYLDHFSAAARAAAERLGLPLVEIPWEVPFARITEELHRELLASQASAIARSEEIHRALTRVAGQGTTLGDLARCLGELLGRSITIEDPAGKVLGFYRVEAQDDPARRATLARRESPKRLLAALERLGILDRIRNSVEPVRVPALGELHLTGRVVCPIRVGGELAGFVWIIEGETPLADLDHRAAEHAALVAALQIAHQRELAQLESRLGYASFISLLEAPTTSPQALERARLLGFDSELSYRVGIAALDEQLPLARGAVLRREAVTERLRRHLTSAGVARPMLGALLDRIAFLVPDQLDLERFGEALDEGVRLVFGAPHTGTEGVRASYREARSLLDYERGGRIVRFEDVLVPRVLLGDPAAREAFLTELFGRLEGKRGARTLRAALLRYAELGFAFRRTAIALGIHPNTLRYRLERATELTGLALGEPEVRFRLELAARLLQLGAADSDARNKKAAES